MAHAFHVTILALLLSLAEGFRNVAVRRDAASEEVEEVQTAASIEGPIDIGGSRVKGYFHKGEQDQEHHVIFKYGDLLHRAQKRKEACGSSCNVTVDFAIYKIYPKIWIGHDGFSQDCRGFYGRVEDHSFGGECADKLIYIAYRAAKVGVKVRVIYHNPQGDSLSDDYGIRSYLMGTLGLPESTPNLMVHRPFWPNGDTTGQMHNKFMLVSQYKGDTDPNVEYTTYVATANVDDKFDYAQSGVLVNRHQELFEHYTKYFDIIWDNTRDILRISSAPEDGVSSQQKFWTDVRSAHAARTLNYNYGAISAYFYPQPASVCDDHSGWSQEFNPMSGLTEKLKTDTGLKYVKVDMYHWKADDFGRKLADTFKECREPCSKKAFVTKDSARRRQVKDILPDMVAFQSKKHKTHAKNLMYAFSSSRNYYTVTGSTNAKLDAICSKANNQLVIHEETPEHPVYTWFKCLNFPC